jgi:hypothetical protein
MTTSISDKWWSGRRYKYGLWYPNSSAQGLIESECVNLVGFLIEKETHLVEVKGKVLDLCRVLEGAVGV